MNRVDVDTFVGGHPHRPVPHPEAEVLARVLAREGVAAAWVGHLPSAFADDPTPGNDALLEELTPYREQLFPTPVVRPDRVAWERSFARELARGAVAVRAYPPQWRLTGHDAHMRALAATCAEARVPLLLTTRLEDPARRDWHGAAPDLDAESILAALRASPRTRVIVTAAGRPLIERTLARCTSTESQRLWWDIARIAGPPRDDLAHLFATIGPSRFLYGSQWPLRLTQTPKSNLALLPDEYREAPLATMSDVIGSSGAS
jgi:predicted TIM-barrel fold metal-dependent hydrolase